MDTAVVQDRTTAPVIGLLPEDTTPGIYTVVVSPDYRIVQSSHWNRDDVLGTCVWDIPGVSEALGADYRYAMETRRRHVARRFWDGAVWNHTYVPLADGNLYVDCECLMIFKPCDKLTLTRFVEFATRASAALTAVADPLSASPRPASAPRSASPARLSVVPDQP